VHIEITSTGLAGSKTNIPEGPYGVYGEDDEADEEDCSNVWYGSDDESDDSCMPDI